MDNRRLLLAVLISGIVLLVWQYWYARMFPPPARPAPLSEAPLPGEIPPAGIPSQASASAVSAASAPSGGLPAPLEPEPELVAQSEEIVELRAEGTIARVTNRGGQLLSFEAPAKEDGHIVEQFVRVRQSGDAYPFALVRPDGTPLPLNDALFQITREGEAGVELRYRGPLGQARKRFILERTGVFRVEVEAQASDDAAQAPWGILLGPGLRNPTLSFLEDKFQNRGVVLGTGSDLDEILARKTGEPTTMPAASYRWVGLEDTYFLTALIPEQPFAQVHAVPVTVSAREDGTVSGSSPLRPDDEAPRELLLVAEPAGSTVVATAFWGAKYYDHLTAMHVGLERTVRWGWFRPVSRLLLYGLNWIHARVVQNYGWSIMLMTMVIRLALFPLTHKSYVSMQKMQKLNPEMEAIRRKYRPKLKDKQGRTSFEMQRKMNEEIQELFRREGVNPAGGCLPLVLQFPVFLAFYYLLRGAVELWDAPWIFWIKDLSAPDPSYVLPLVMGATQLLQTRMMPPAPNPAQRIILNTMPIWFTVLSLGFPAGLVLYWLTNNVLTILQQGGYNRLKKAGVLGGEAVEAARAKPRGAPPGTD